MKGRHSVRFGIQAQFRRFEHLTEVPPRGGFTFNGLFSGNSIADFLLVEFAAGNDLEQVEGGGVEGIVASAGLRIGNRVTLLLEGGACPGLVALPSLILCTGELDEPARSRDGPVGTGWVPLIESAIGAAARRQADIAAIAADIDALTYLAGAVVDLNAVGPSEDEVPAAARRDAHQRLR